MKTVLLAALFLATALCAQEHRKVLGLGMSIDEVERQFGKPVAFSLLGHQYKTPPEVTGDHPLYCVYRRLTKENEYEILVHYRADGSLSRLHPTLKIDEMRFKLDRATPMKQALDDIPEAGLACGSGCHIMVDYRRGMEISLSTNADGTGNVVTGTVTDSTGAAAPIHEPDLAVSDVVIWTSHVVTTIFMRDTGSIWRSASH